MKQAGLAAMLGLVEGMRYTTQLEAVMSEAGRTIEEAQSILKEELDAVRPAVEEPLRNVLDRMEQEYGRHYPGILASASFSDLFNQFRTNEFLGQLKGAGRRFASRIKELCPNSTLTAEWGEEFILSTSKSALKTLNND